MDTHKKKTWVGHLVDNLVVLYVERPPLVEIYVIGLNHTASMSNVWCPNIKRETINTHSIMLQNILVITVFLHLLLL